MLWWCVEDHAITSSKLYMPNLNDSWESFTVKPPKKGHFGDGPVVPCREVVLFSEVFF